MKRIQKYIKDYKKTIGYLVNYGVPSIIFFFKLMLFSNIIFRVSEDSNVKISREQAGNYSMIYALYKPTDLNRANGQLAVLYDVDRTHPGGEIVVCGDIYG